VLSWIAERCDRVIELPAAGTAASDLRRRIEGCDRFAGRAQLRLYPPTRVSFRRSGEESARGGGSFQV
jgi:hypothetical protein